jgi:Rad3-related DNA helicase
MQYTVAVRTLCEFTARRGDLDLRFTPVPSAQEGVIGHQVVTGRRGAAYETELTLRGTFEDLVVRGRADGYDADRNRLEEIKTHRGDLAKQPANHRHLHWAQAKVYGWLLCEARNLEDIELALVYFDIGTQEETVLVERHDAVSLRGFFEALCRDFLTWARQEAAHRAARDDALANLRFPHASFRTGQRELAEAVYKGAASGRCVMAQAPTGIGKTIATVFAMLKAATPHALDKVYYLTAKTTGRQLALDAAAHLRSQQRDFPVRVIELTARDKACEHPDKACHGDSCPLARGFYDRLPAARTACVAHDASLDRPALRAIAQRHEVCPYYLAQELTRWCDLVVGDYNYHFDQSAMLHTLALLNEWRVGVLVDEAHNLVERARTMYSAQLDQTALREARRGAAGRVRTALDKVQRGWSAVREARDDAGGALREIPGPFLAALRNAGGVLEQHFAESAAGAQQGELQEAYFAIFGFLRLADAFGAHSVLEVAEAKGRMGKPDLTLRIQNLVPAPFLKQRFSSARSVTLFSATLSPSRYYRDMLGLPEDAAWIDVASPFSAEQLEVRVVRSISTRYPDRARSAAPIARLIGEHYHAKPGNYLAFFSSYDYLEQVAAEFQQRHPAIPAWSQERGMDEAQRTAFLDRFAPGGQGVGFAVLGGSFGEGIDLRGDRLVGAFVATLGLPQLNARNEQLKACLQEFFGAGYDYAYLYPGLQKVVQAAGRVIRTTEDRGLVVLIDDRFARPAVRELLPSWWRVQEVV